MAGRIVLFGATGYTGRLVADALVERGARPVLAARSAGKLEQMAEELGGLETTTADIAQPESVRAIVERGDVLVTTVGPFLRFGEPALHAAVESGAAYIDSTGESSFIRRVFEELGPRAERSGCALVTACGYDYVPGNLAAALALREAGEAARRVEVGYFTTGSQDPRAMMSGGTAASAAEALIEPSFGFQSGRIVDERSAKRLATFDVDGRQRQGVSIGTSEHFSLPRIHPSLRDVDVYLGWFGPASRAVQGVSLAGSAFTRVPGALPAARGAVRRFARGSSGGPDAEARAKSGSRIAARVCDGGGRVLSEAYVQGVNGYTFTGRIMAWAAMCAMEPGIEGVGALGPVEAFGLEALEAGCAECGLEARVTQRTTD